MRINRLQNIMASLRLSPGGVRAEDLARTHGVSTHSIYRDIETLRGMGGQIDGTPGLGYTLIEDHALRPQNYTIDEVEALMLGLREVQELGDAPLAEAARHAAAKLKASLSSDMAHKLEHSVLHARRFRARPPVVIDTQALRKASRAEVKVMISYEAHSGAQTQRIIWPLGIVSMDNAMALLGWCELRNDNRAFRLDRIKTMEVTKESFRPHRVPKLRDFKAAMMAETQSGMSCAKPKPERPSSQEAQDQPKT